MLKSPSRAVSAVAILAALALPAAAQDIVPDVPTTLVAVPNSPVTLTSCRLHKGTTYTNEWRGPVELRNRTTHALARAQILVTAYDQDGKVGQAVVMPDMVGTVASGDSTVNQLDAQVALGGTDPKLVTWLTCRIDSATFSGRKTWKYGQAWKERLLPLATPAPAAQQ